MEDSRIDENKIRSAGCEYCNSDYDQEITAEVTRYHSTGDTSWIPIRVIYCPNCGRKLS